MSPRCYSPFRSLNGSSRLASYRILRSVGNHWDIIYKMLNTIPGQEIHALAYALNDMPEESRMKALKMLGIKNAEMKLECLKIIEDFQKNKDSLDPLNVYPHVITGWHWDTQGDSFRRCYFCENPFKSNQDFHWLDGKKHAMHHDCMAEVLLQSRPTGCLECPRDIVT